MNAKQKSIVRSSILVGAVLAVVVGVKTTENVGFQWIVWIFFDLALMAQAVAHSAFLAAKGEKNPTPYLMTMILALISLWVAFWPSYATTTNPDLIAVGGVLLWCGIYTFMSVIVALLYAQEAD